MPDSASAIRLFSLERWVRLPAARARCVGHFLAIAATLAAAKVLLSTVGVALFVAEQGAAGLPPFYLGFAAIAILLSFGLSSTIDRAPKARLAQITFAALLVGTAALRLLLALEVPGVSFALLASATAFEIILDIVFWVVVAAYLDAFEFRRATPLVYMAFALGGAAGGMVGRIGASAVPPADLLLLLIPAAAIVVAQLGVVASRLREVPEHHADAADGGLERPGLIALGRIVRRYPLALLIALNALAGTLLYGLSEFLIVSIYEARFASEAELAEFLSVLFAFMQILEFGLLYTLTRFLLERTGPLVRNLVFPLTSLSGLVFLTVSPRLLAAVVVHVNIETLANVLLLPVSNANYVALPLGVQGRARTLSEGIFYPIGLALAGAVLWTVDPAAAVLQVEFAALIFAALFVLLGTAVGLLFRPTLQARVGAGLITPGHTLNAATDVPTASGVSALLQSREPELRLHGIALARRMDPAQIEEALHDIARRSDRVTRTGLAQLVADAPEPWAQKFLDRCLAADSEGELDLGLLVMLIRRAPLKPEHLPRALEARDPSIGALGAVVAQGSGAWPGSRPLVGSSRIASDLVDALVCAGRTDHAPLLLACLESAGPERQRRALAMLNAVPEPLPGAAADPLRLWARRGSAAVRAEAIVALSRTMPRAAAVRRLVAALDDPSPRVRRRAAQALCRQGDRATALLRHQLGTVTAASVDVVWTLAWIGSPSARRLLAAYVRMLQQDGERTAQLRGRIAASPEHPGWAALELCLEEHHARLLDVILAALSPAIEPPLMRRLRHALHGADQRYRASAFELVAAGRASRFVPGAVAVLRYLLFEHGSGAGDPGGSSRERQGDLLDQARVSMDPWVRRAATLLAGCPGSLPEADQGRLRGIEAPPPHPARGAGSGLGHPAGDRAMDLDDREFERVLALKGTPLFRHVPLEALLEMARSLQARAYLAGERVMTDGAGGQALLVLESGVLAIGHEDGVSTLAAPACIGEVAIAGEPIDWPSITAVEDARVSLLRATVFEELCREHPDVALELCRLLARRVRAAEAADHG